MEPFNRRGWVLMSGWWFDVADGFGSSDFDELFRIPDELLPPLQPIILPAKSTASLLDLEVPQYLPGDTGAELPYDPGDEGDGPQPPSPPPPPTDGREDYSHIFNFDDDFFSWLEGELSTGGGGSSWGTEQDSLYWVTDGRFFEDIDAELYQQPGGGSGSGGGFYRHQDAYGQTIGFGYINGAGERVVMYREWFETFDVPADPNDPESIPGVGIRFHREFCGTVFVTESRFSADDPFGLLADWARRAEVALDGAGLAQIFNQFLEAFDEPPETNAASQFMVRADGRVEAIVLGPNGEWMGHVIVGDDGVQIRNRNYGIIDYLRVGDIELLPQHWNDIQGGRFMEHQFSREHRVGAPFANALIQLSLFPISVTRSFFAGLGFDFLTNATTGAMVRDAAADARFMEAAYEARRWQLSRR